MTPSPSEARRMADALMLARAELRSHTRRLVTEKEREENFAAVRALAEPLAYFEALCGCGGKRVA